MIELTLTLLIGMFLIYMSYKSTSKQCVASNKIEYRFIPRTLQERQENPAKPNDIFKKMFDSRSIHS